MRVQFTARVGSFEAKLFGFRWRLHAERFVEDYRIWVGPMFLMRDGLPFSLEAAGREFDKMDHPDRPLRKLADLYRSRG